METTIIILIAAYLLFTSYLGFCAHRSAQATAEDYFVARRNISWLHLGLTFFATWFSTLAFLGVSGFNYNRGVSWYFAQGSFWMLAPIAAWVLGRKLWKLGKRHGYITPGDLLADRYKSSLVRFLTGAISVLALVPYTLVQLVGIGKVFEASTHGTISYSLGVAITAIATALYTVVGGVRAIVWTDVIQGCLFLSVTVFGVIIAIDAADGLFYGLSLAQQTRPEIFAIDLSNIGKPLTTIIIWTPGFVLLPHLWQRNYMAESETAFSKSIVVFSLMSFVLLLATMLIGTLAISFMNSLTDSDKLVPILFRDYAPVFLPLLVLATFAAGMSTIDSQLLTASSVIIRDVLRPLGLPQISETKEKLLGRVVVVLLILSLSQLALLPESQGAIFTLASKGTALAFLLFVPLVATLTGRDNCPRSGVLTLVAGLLVYTLLELKIVNYTLPLGFGPPIAAFIAQVCMFATVSRLKS